MSGGVPAGEKPSTLCLACCRTLKEHGAKRQCPETTYFIANRATPTPPIEGRDAGVERVRALVEAVEAGKFDTLDAVADQWIEGAGIVRMCNAIASVFEAHAPQEIMDRFRAKLADMMHLAFVEGAAQGTLQALGERG